MTILTSSGFQCKASMNRSGFSRRVMSRANQPRSARANAWLALYQCRLLALTLPTTRSFRSTESSRDIGRCETGRGTACTYACEAHDAARRDGLHGASEELPHGSALDDAVRLKPDAGDRAGVIGRAQGAHELGLGS